MNTKFASVKKNFSAVADKVTSSKAYKAVEKGAVLTAGTLGTMAMTAFNACATEVDNTLANAITVDTADILNKAQPFITPAITILCCVGGIKLGMRFLKGSMH